MLPHTDLCGTAQPHTAAILGRLPQRVPLVSVTPEGVGRVRAAGLLL